MKQIKEIKRNEVNGKTYGFHCPKCPAILPTLNGVRTHYNLMHKRGDSGEQVLLRLE